MPVAEQQPRSSLGEALSQTLQELRVTSARLRTARNGNSQQNDLIDRATGILDSVRGTILRQLPHLVLNILAAPSDVERQHAPVSAGIPIQEPAGVIFEELLQPTQELEAPTLKPPPILIPEGFVSLQEAIRILGMSKSHWNRIRDNFNPATVKVGAHTFYRAEDLLVIKQEREDGKSKRKARPTTSGNDLRERDGDELNGFFYDREINKIPLLTAKEEQQLSAQIYEAKFALWALRQIATTTGFPASLTARVQSVIATGEGQYLLEDFDEEIIHRSTAIKDEADREFNESVVQFDARPSVTPDQDFVERLLEQVESGKRAFDDLVKQNLRLVRKIALAFEKKQRKLPIKDLIGYGNLGLMKAAVRFDWKKGYRFSTYATGWIKQHIARAIMDFGSNIRIPVHLVEVIHKVSTAQERLIQEQGRMVSFEEAARDIGVDSDSLLSGLGATNIISLNLPVGEDEESELADILPVNGAVVEEEMDSILLQKDVTDVLLSLTERERRILQMRFGLNGERPKTLEEIGVPFGLTRERIRHFI
ncbi:sigma-70 family RNA polymerase sigma factor [Candidatus Microgenomates bacterium]|nr:sigma-70 family RNA polymerase sigma factor [Candidatus Microgenomates bacterium]